MQTLIKASLLFVFIFTSYAHAQPSEIACLATNIYFEGRGESTEGMRAIGSVVINRSRHPSFKEKTLCGVTFARGQFSWVKQQPKKAIQRLLNGDLSGLKDEDKEAYQKAEGIAVGFLLSAYRPSTPTWVVAFHNSSVSPAWSRTMKKYKRIGNHQFYGFSSVTKSYN